MSRLLILYSMILLSPQLFFAQSSRNGYWHTTHGEIRILYVFAEITGDPQNVSGSWQTGKMPQNVESYLDTNYFVPTESP